VTKNQLSLYVTLIGSSIHRYVNDPGKEINDLSNIIATEFS